MCRAGRSSLLLLQSAIVLLSVADSVICATTKPDSVSISSAVDNSSTITNTSSIEGSATTTSRTTSTSSANTTTSTMVGLTNSALTMEFETATNATLSLMTIISSVTSTASSTRPTETTVSSTTSSVTPSNPTPETSTLLTSSSSASLATSSTFSTESTTTPTTTSTALLTTTSTPSTTRAPTLTTLTTSITSEADVTAKETSGTTVAESPAGPSNGWKIAVAVVVPVVVIAIIAAILLYFFCRSCRNKEQKKSRGPDSWTIARRPSLTNSKPCPVDQFVQHVTSMEKDSGLIFASEFEELKTVGKNQSHDTATAPKNREKNRFANIQPYDMALVKLKPMNGDNMEADYINASWLPGYNSKREYISTQGPMPNTRDDFWRMIWEYECRGVVMLANCMENGMIKCDHYWPHDRDPTIYGDLMVTITKERLTDQWDVRDMQISMGQKVHHIKHFHYHVWDDMVVPKHPDSILHFLQVVREEIGSLESSSKLTGTKPLVVHCSAGVGRSGTFIALDTLLRQMNANNVVDVFGVVYKLRMNRINMVQTEMQYIFLHKCLAHVIETMKGKDNLAYVKDSADGTQDSTPSVTSFTGPAQRSNGKVPTVFGAGPPVTNSSNAAKRNSPLIRNFPPGREVSPSSHSDPSIGIPSMMSSNPNSIYYDLSHDSQLIGLVNLAPPTPVSTSPTPSPRQRSHAQSRDPSLASVYITPTSSPYDSNIQIECL